MPQKFQVNDKVQTNLAYTKGFDGGICPPSGLNWLKT
jgi:hypothetical protein